MKSVIKKTIKAVIKAAVFLIGLTLLIMINNKIFWWSISDLPKQEQEQVAMAVAAL